MMFTVTCALSAAVAMLVLPAAAAVLSPRTGSGRATATVALTDDAGSAALFPGTARFSPGTTRSACITLSAPDAVAGDTVTIDVTDLTGPLAPWLHLDVQSGDGGRFGNCAGFSGATIYSGTLAGLAAATARSGAPTGWDPAAEAVRRFRFTVTLSASTPLSLAGRTSQVGFRWRLVTSRDPTSELRAPDPSTPGPAPTSVSPPYIASDPGPSPSSPSPTPGPTGSPAAAPVWPDGDAGDGSSDGSAPAPVRLLPPLPDRLANTMLSVLDRPQFTLTPLLIAMLFLFVQHLIDGRDPKLATASRTQRDLTLEFPRTYRRTAE
jgi:hypothetical protein